MRTAYFTLFLALGALAQAQDFEVATVRVSEPPVLGQLRRTGTTGGPGTPDPGRFNCAGCPFWYLITLAYNMNRFQVDSPRWMDDQRYDITAKVPAGATKEQLQSMLRNLLAARFRMATHLESKELPIYALVAATNGPKLKPAVDDEGGRGFGRTVGAAAPPLVPVRRGSGR